MADKITQNADGELNVSDNPIIPFIEGDGIGVDIWPASKLVLDAAAKNNWRMPPLAMLAPVQMSAGRRVGMLAMWAYLGLAFVLVIVRVVELAVAH